MARRTRRGRSSAPVAALTGVALFIIAPSLLGGLGVGGCGASDHPSGIRILGITPGTCAEGGSLLFGRVPLRIEPEGVGTFASVEVSVISGGTLPPLTDHEAPFIVDLDTTKLNDGAARLRLDATDSAGSTLSRQIDVCVDNTPPELAVISPLPGTPIGIEDAQLAVRVSVDDAAGIASVTARIVAPGAYQEVTCAPPGAKEQVCTLHPGELTIPHESSKKTQLTLTVTARDGVGHERTVSRLIEVGTRLRWRYQVGSPITWRALVTSRGAVVVATDTGILLVLDAQGKERCSFSAPFVSGQSDPISTPPTLATIGSRELVFFATKQTVWAVDVTTCKKQWSRQGGLYLASRPAYDPAKDVLYIGSYGDVATHGSLRAFRGTSGRPLGTLAIAEIDKGVTGSPVLSPDGKTVYIGSSDGNLYAANVEKASTMTERWKFSVGAKIDSAPLLTPQTLFVSSLARTLHALDPIAGNPLSTFSFTAQAGFMSSPVMAPSKILYVASLDENLYALDASGKELAHFRTGRVMRSSPIVGPGGLVYAARTKPGKLYALSPKLELLWSAQGSSDTETFKGTPTIAGNILYIGSSSGFLYAYDITPSAP